MKMNKCAALLCLFLFGLVSAASAEVLIVADEFPAMQTLAARLKSAENIDSKIVSQTNLPPSLAPYQAVLVYIHGNLQSGPENAFIDYAQSGGKLILLHHSISTGKRKNAHWFTFLGVKLPEGDLSKGGYKWIENKDVTWHLVNLAPNHFIMTNKVVYPEKITYASATIPTPGGSLPGFTFSEDEVYLNHVLIGPRTLLMGFKYTDATNAVTYMQDSAGWIKPAGKGWVVYLMPGHWPRDFESPVYSRIVINAVIYQP
jgi:hypothetical protein